MNMRRPFVLLLLLLSVSCRERGQSAVPVYNVDRELEGVTLSGDMDGSYFIGLKKDTLVFSAESKDRVLSLSAVDEDNLISVPSSIFRGRGPLEMMMPMSKIDSKGNYYAVERTGGSADRMDYTTNGLKDLDTKSGMRSVDLSWLNLTYVSNFAVIDEENIIVLGFNQEDTDLLHFVDLNARQSEGISFWPGDSRHVTDIADKMILVNNARIFINDDKLLYVCGEGRVAKILQLNGDVVENETDIYSSIPLYKKDNLGNNFFIQKGQERGINAYATMDRIYLVVMGEMDHTSNYKGYSYYCRDEIEVYDWSGSFICKYRTDQPFINFVVSEDDSTIFTFTEDLSDNEPMVRKYVVK